MDQLSPKATTSLLPPQGATTAKSPDSILNTEFLEACKDFQSCYNKICMLSDEIAIRGHCIESTILEGKKDRFFALIQSKEKRIMRLINADKKIQILADHCFSYSRNSLKIFDSDFFSEKLDSHYLTGKGLILPSQIDLKDVKIVLLETNRKVNLQFLKLFPCLVMIKIINCPALKSLETLPKLPSVKEVFIHDCASLETMQGIENCDKLESFHAPIIDERSIEKSLIAFFKSIKDISFFSLREKRYLFKKNIMDMP